MSSEVLQMVSLGFLAMYLPAYVCPEPTEVREIKNTQRSKQKKKTLKVTLGLAYLCTIKLEWPDLLKAGESNGILRKVFASIVTPY